MTALKPKQKISDLINRAVDMVTGDDPILQFDLLRLRKEAMALLTSNSANPAHCHMCLGMVEFMARNREECLKHFNNAIVLAPSDDIIYKNLMLVYSDFGCYDEVLSFGKQMVAKFPGIKSVCLTAITELFNALQISQVEHYFELYKKMDLDYQNEFPKRLFEGIGYMKPMFVEKEISESHVLDLLKTAVSTLRNAGFEVVQTNVVMLSDKTAIHQMFIDADAAVCAENNFLIADSLVEQYEDTGMEYLSILCRPISHRSKTELISID